MIKNTIAKNCPFVNKKNQFPFLTPRIIPGNGKFPRKGLNGYNKFPPTTNKQLTLWNNQQPIQTTLVRVGNIGDGTGWLCVIDIDYPERLPVSIHFPTNFYVKTCKGFHFYFFASKNLPFNDGKLVIQGEHIGDFKCQLFVVGPGNVHKESQLPYVASAKFDDVPSLSSYSGSMDINLQPLLQSIPNNQLFELIESLGVKPFTQSDKSVANVYPRVYGKSAPPKVLTKNPYKPIPGQRYFWLKKEIWNEAKWYKKRDFHQYCRNIAVNPYKQIEDTYSQGGFSPNQALEIADGISRNLYEKEETRVPYDFKRFNSEQQRENQILQVKTRNRKSELRNARIKRMHKQGTSQKQIAIQFGLARSTVQNILNK